MILTRALQFARNHILSTLIMVAVISALSALILTDGNQGTASNRLDEVAIKLELTGRSSLGHGITWVSANLLHSPVAAMKLGYRLTKSSDMDSAWKYYFPAVWKVPALGLEAGKKTLQHVTTDNDIGIAATYLVRAAMLANNAEASRLLGLIALVTAHEHQISCANWKHAMKYFEESARKGDGYGQLITALSYGLGLHTNISRSKLLGYLLVARGAKDKNAAVMAEYIMGQLPPIITISDFPEEELIPHPSENLQRSWLADALSGGVSGIEYFNSGNLMALPEFCSSNWSTCNPYKEPCDVDATPLIQH